MQKDGTTSPSKESILLLLYEGTEQFEQLSLLFNNIATGMTTIGEKLKFIIFREKYHGNYNQTLESEEV